MGPRGRPDLRHPRSREPSVTNWGGYGIRLVETCCADGRREKMIEFWENLGKIEGKLREILRKVYESKEL